MLISDESTVHAATRAEQAPSGHGPGGAAHELAPDDVAERFRWARTRGQPTWLWPGVEVSDWRRALHELQRAAHALLRGRGAVVLSNVPDVPAMTVAAYTSGLGPWLGWHCEAGRLATRGEVAALFASHLDHARRRVERLRRTLSDAVAAGARAESRVTVLKGMHSAHVYFAEPALRPMADVDVLVAGPRVGAVEAALAESGYHERAAGRQRGPYRSEWGSPHGSQVLRSLSLTHAEDPIAVDVHASLDIDFHGVRTVSFDTASALRAGAPAAREAPPSLGRGAAVLDQPLLAAHHAVHASNGLHGLTLLRLLELSLILRQDMQSSAHWRALGELLRELDAERFAFPAFALAAQLAPHTVEPALLARLANAASPRLRALVSRLTPASAQRLGALALSERFMYAHGALEHAKRAAFMLLPTGPRGPVQRLARIYVNRGYRLIRRQVSWHDAG